MLTFEANIAWLNIAFLNHKSIMVSLRVFPTPPQTLPSTECRTKRHLYFTG